MIDWKYRELTKSTESERISLLPLIDQIVEIAGYQFGSGVPLKSYPLKDLDPLLELGLTLIIEDEKPEKIYEILNERINVSGKTGIDLLSDLIILEGVIGIWVGLSGHHLLYQILVSYLGMDLVSNWKSIKEYELNVYSNEKQENESGEDEPFGNLTVNPDKVEDTESEALVSEFEDVFDLNLKDEEISAIISAVTDAQVEKEDSTIDTSTKLSPSIMDESYYPSLTFSTESEKRSLYPLVELLFRLLVNVGNKGKDSLYADLNAVKDHLLRTGLKLLLAETISPDEIRGIMETRVIYGRSTGKELIGQFIVIEGVLGIGELLTEVRFKLPKENSPTVVLERILSFFGEGIANDFRKKLTWTGL